MRVFYGFDEVPKLQNPIVTIGVYDGVHVGHREILSRLKSEARRRSGESVVITFDPHPRLVLDSMELKLLTTLQEKIILLERFGIDNLIVVPFDREFSQISSYDFVCNYLIDKINASMLVVGYDHHFGRDRGGNFDYLATLKSEFGFEVIEVSAKLGDGREISSTLIREMVASGDIVHAGELLGEPYMVIGTWRKGRLLGVDQDKLLPTQGCYRVIIKQSGVGDIDGELIINESGELSLRSQTKIKEGESIIVMFI